MPGAPRVENILLVVVHLKSPPITMVGCAEAANTWVAAPPRPPANGPRSQRASEEIRNVLVGCASTRLGVDELSIGDEPIVTSSPA